MTLSNNRPIIFCISGGRLKKSLTVDVSSCGEREEEKGVLSSCARPRGPPLAKVKTSRRRPSLPRASPRPPYLKADSWGDLRLDGVNHGLENVGRVLENVAIVAQEPHKRGARLWRRLDRLELNELKNLRHKRLALLRRLRRSGCRKVVSRPFWSPSLSLPHMPWKQAKAHSPCAGRRASPSAPRT